MSQRIIPQPTVSHTLQRRLSMPVADHGFDVVSDPPPLVRVEPVEKAAKPPKQAE